MSISRRQLALANDRNIIHLLIRALAGDATPACRRESKKWKVPKTEPIGTSTCSAWQQRVDALICSQMWPNIYLKNIFTQIPSQSTSTEQRQYTVAASGCCGILEVSRSLAASRCNYNIDWCETIHTVYILLYDWITYSYPYKCTRYLLD